MRVEWIVKPHNQVPEQWRGCDERKSSGVLILLNRMPKHELIEVTHAFLASFVSQRFYCWMFEFKLLFRAFTLSCSHDERFGLQSRRTGLRQQRRRGWDGHYWLWPRSWYARGCGWELTCTRWAWLAAYLSSRARVPDNLNRNDAISILHPTFLVHSKYVNTWRRGSWCPL